MRRRALMPPMTMPQSMQSTRLRTRTAQRVQHRRVQDEQLSKDGSSGCFPQPA